MQKSLSQIHAEVCNDKKFLEKTQRPLNCVYIIDGRYVGATNDLKRRIREYIGRANRDEKHGLETPIMAYIKERIKHGHRVKFFILCSNPLMEGKYIKKYIKRGIQLLNNTEAPDYASCYGKE